MVDPAARPAPVDYDTDPGRWQTFGALTQHRFGEDIHGDVAGRIAAEGAAPVLDVGCGRGALLQPLRDLGVPAIGFDASPTMLGAAPGLRVRGDARFLPFADASFGSVAALYMLYHLPDPRLVIAEGHRVLKPGGLFAASAPSRNNDPELKPYLPEEALSTFDAESRLKLVADQFQDVDVDRWDLPYYRLPDKEAVAQYIYGHQFSRDVAERVADQVELPLTLTKRGAIIYGYKRD